MCLSRMSLNTFGEVCLSEHSIQMQKYFDCFTDHDLKMLKVLRLKFQFKHHKHLTLLVIR